MLLILSWFASQAGGSKVQRQEACSGDADSVAVVSWARSFPAACKPAILQLTKNYRSHRGILKAAGVVLDLLTHFFKGTQTAIPEVPTCALDTHCRHSNPPSCLCCAFALPLS